MKWIKLFEEFKDSQIKYEIRPGVSLSEDGKMLVNEVDHFKALVDYLNTLGYRDRWDEYQKYLDLDWSIYSVSVAYWNILTGEDAGLKYVFTSQSSKSMISDFDKYFQLKHEFRGHKMQKYGV